MPSEFEIIHEQQAQKKKSLTLCIVCAANLEIIPVINKIDLPGKYQVYLLYWYKSTNTDADAPARRQPREIQMLESSTSAKKYKY